MFVHLFAALHLLPVFFATEFIKREFSEPSWSPGSFQHFTSSDSSSINNEHETVGKNSEFCQLCVFLWVSRTMLLIQTNTDSKYLPSDKKCDAAFAYDRAFCVAAAYSLSIEYKRYASRHLLRKKISLFAGLHDSGRNISGG